MNVDPSVVFGERCLAVRKRLADIRLDALIVSALPNVRYLTGFTGSNGLLVVSVDHATLITDPRYDLQAHQQAPNCRIRVVRGSPWKPVPAILRRQKARRTGFEAHNLAHARWDELRGKAGKQVRLKPAGTIVEELRMVKSPPEIDAIRQAVEVNSKAFRAAMGRFRASMTERDLAAEIDYQMKRLGAENPSFETIVASGPRSALPHARPEKSPILVNELLLIDMGAHCGGYASDMTRMAVPGRPSQKMKQRYKAVLEAQLAAIDVVRAGVKVTDVDRQVRDVLGKELEPLFVHSTGHGLGLEIHEPPRLAKKEKARLQPGMVITIEPGIYDANWGGIRIEDTVLVTPSGCEILTPTSKDLLTL